MHSFAPPGGWGCLQRQRKGLKLFKKGSSCLSVSVCLSVCLSVCQTVRCYLTVFPYLSAHPSNPPPPTLPPTARPTVWSHTCRSHAATCERGGGAAPLEPFARCRLSPLPRAAWERHGGRAAAPPPSSGVASPPPVQTGRRPLSAQYKPDADPASRGYRRSKRRGKGVGGGGRRGTCTSPPSVQ